MKTNRSIRLYFITICVLIISLQINVRAEDIKITLPETDVPVMKTFGGRQFWADVHFFQGWRIQKNIHTNHYRLLDPKDFRFTSGTLDECLEKLETIKKERDLDEMSGSAVIVIHGILRSSKSFSLLKKTLKQDHYEVVSFDYPSSQIELTESAEYLHQTIESMKGIKEIDFVVHSMGGLLVRTYLRKHRDPRIRRMVMMGVPNLGARMADHLKSNLLFKAIFGPAGQQLISDKNGFIFELPVPEFEFGIIAGARGTPKGYNPFIPDDDDGTVSVTSTRLQGATDFITVHCLHSFLPGHKEANDLAIRFIETGKFRKEGDPQPIPLEEEKPDTVSSLEDKNSKTSE